MEKPFINFKEERDFNSLITDTIDFLRQEFKPFVKSLFTYAGPFILITSFLLAKYQGNMYSHLTAEDLKNPLWVLNYVYSTDYILYLISYLISNTILTLVVYSYVKLYVERGKDKFAPEDVWRTLGQYFLPVFFIVLALGFIIAAGLMLFIIPGIFLAIATVFTIYIRVAENLSFGDALRRSMYLVKGNWWFTLGVLLIVYLIASFAGSVFLIPQIIFNTIFSLNIAEGSTQNVSIFYIIITAAGAFIANFFYAIVYLTTTFLYYSYVEKKDKPELINEIEQINED